MVAKPRGGDGDGDGGRPPRKLRTADELAEKQRDISVSEFFVKNRPPARLRQPAEGAPDHRQGGGGQRPRRLRGGRGPAGGDRRDHARGGPRGGELHSAPATGGNGHAARTAPARPRPRAPPTRPARPSRPATPLRRPPAPRSRATTASSSAPSSTRTPTRGHRGGGGGEGRQGVDARQGQEGHRPAGEVRRRHRDNGPASSRSRSAGVGKLLYGSKFHRLKQQRGQQGIGISAAGMYGQLTTGKPVRITSRTSKRSPPTTWRSPSTCSGTSPTSGERGRGVGPAPGHAVEIELEAKYQKGQRSVDTYLRATALANPHVTVRYRDPEATGRSGSAPRGRCPPSPRRSARTPTASSWACSCRCSR